LPRRANQFVGAMETASTRIEKSAAITDFIAASLSLQLIGNHSPTESRNHSRKPIV
jgi:hypothetical protein